MNVSNTHRLKSLEDMYNLLDHSKNTRLMPSNVLLLLCAGEHSSLFRFK